ncbi:MAG: RSP_7527 family protein [Alphaproteobacteria bacterium]
MTDFTREIDARYPTYEDVDAIIKEARHLRARAMRDGAISLWSMLQRVVAVKPTPAETRHA